MPDLLLQYLNPNNDQGIEPSPNSTLLNDSQNIKFSITPGLTYRLRIISMSTFVGHYVSLIGHTMNVIMVDSCTVHEAPASSIYISVAQRYDILFTAKPTATQNYFFVSSIDQTMIGGTYTLTYPQAYGYLVYNHLLPLPTPYVPIFNPIDDFGLVPYDNTRILTPPATTITINMVFENDQYDINR